MGSGVDTGEPGPLAAGQGPQQELSRQVGSMRAMLEEQGKLLRAMAAQGSTQASPPSSPVAKAKASPGRLAKSPEAPAGQAVLTFDLPPGPSSGEAGSPRPIAAGAMGGPTGDMF